MKQAQDSVRRVAVACFDSTRSAGHVSHAECIVSKHGDTGVFMAAEVSQSSRFDPRTFVVADSGDPQYQILVMPQLYWHKSLE